MKPRTRFYIYVAFLLLSARCLGGTLVICALYGGVRNFLTALVFLFCGAAFLQAIRQMLNLKD